MNKGDKFYLIYAGTGCTCCNYENHYRGPYKTREDAQRRIDYYKSSASKYWPLASQYSKRGNYSIEEFSVYEIIFEDELVCIDSYGDKFVVDYLNFIDVKEDGSTENNDERFYGYE